MLLDKLVNAKAVSNSSWHVLLATWLGELFDGMDASIFVLVLFPALSELTGSTSHSTIGLVGSVLLAIFMLGWACGAVVFGILADNIGRARTLVVTILLYAICTGLCALSHNWGELAFYRFLVGAGIGGEISIGAVMLSECWRGSARLHATAAMGTSFGFGYLAAALLNLVLGNLGWRWLFLAGVVPALVTVYIRAKLSEPEQFQLVRQLKRQLKGKPKSELTQEEARLMAFTFPEIFAKDNRGKIMVVVGLASTAIIGYWAVLSWIPAWVNQLTGTLAVQERSTTAIAMNCGAIFFVVFAGFLVHWLGRVNAFRFAFAGALLTAWGMFLSVKAFGWLLLLWVFLVGGFATLPFAFLFIYVPELFNARIRATAFGFSVQVGRLMAAVAALAGGQLIAMFGGSYAVAGASVATMYIMGIIASFFMPETSGEVEAGLSIASDVFPENASAPAVVTCNRLGDNL